MGARQAEVETGRTLDEGAVLTRGTHTHGTARRTGWAPLQAAASAATPQVPSLWLELPSPVPFPYCMCPTGTSLWPWAHDNLGCSRGSLT